MNIQLIDRILTSDLHEKAKTSERLRMNFDLRTTPNDTSQRMLNALEVGTHISIHRHFKTSETIICVEGCLNLVFYNELPNKAADGSIHNGEIAADESCFKETARFRVCPREGRFGIQVPQGMWHSVDVLEVSTIFEAKDGAYVVNLAQNKTDI